jgi:hypothetical protein
MSYRTTRLARGLLIGAGLSLIVGTFVAPSVSAQTSGNVPVVGNYDGSGVGPLIECAWALPDPTASWSDRMNGYTSGGSPANDDAPGTKPSTPPCKNGPAATNGSARPTQASQGGPTTPGHIQVYPNLDDDPNVRYVELWAAVDAVAAVSSLQPTVIFNVYHPDGTFKVEVDATNYTPGNVISRCAGPAGMFDMAIATGQIDANSVRNNTSNIHDSIQDWCAQNKKDLYYGAFGLSKHQPYGSYRIDAIVTTPSGASSTLKYWIDVLPIKALAKDFNTLDFGPLHPNDQFTVDGDTSWQPPNSANPTLQNIGNQGLTISLSYTNLCLDLAGSRECGPIGGNKRVDMFDGGFGTSINTVEHRGSGTASDPWIPSADVAGESLTGPSFLNAVDTSGNYTNPRYRTLCPNDLGKLDFSAHTPPQLIGGTYKGAVHIRVTTSLECNTDKGKVYFPFNAQFPAPGPATADALTTNPDVINRTNVQPYSASEPSRMFTPAVSGYAG